MRIVHFSKYDIRGGAALAAFSSVVAQRDAGADATLHVGRKEGDAPFVFGPTGLGRLISKAGFVGERLPFWWRGRPPEVRSLGLFGVDAPAIARDALADVVMLHAIDGIVRLADLPRFHCPVVWRTHDLFAMCGTEHYADPARFRTDRPNVDLLSRWTFARKRRAYRATSSLTVSAISAWVAEEYAASALFAGRRTVSIANGIDTDLFSPAAMPDARAALGLPADVPLILFGATGGTEDPRKGFDLLADAIERQVPALLRLKTELVIFGSDEGPISVSGIPVRNLGRVADRARLRMAYSAADVMVVPSRREGLGLTAIEANACGTPVIAFAVGGLPDVIRNGESGWLVEPFDTGRLADRLIEALSSRSSIVRKAARASAVARFDRRTEASAMLELFSTVIADAAQGEHNA